ncbi:MAG: hypothetical protein A2583_13795 [Bdellovibrionales bacterium RIFOXYD1_FULL_53_11]|nr:MAG: hypothetical protein A2583_13795 [Bdellovibrionales bacterium RIFOXYD1_FULL_53_11]
MKTKTLARNAWWLAPVTTFTVAALIVMSGCASMSNRTKTITGVVIAGAGAGTLGAILAPKEENRAMHGVFWGASAAAVSGIAGLFIFDEESRRKEAELKSEKLSKELAAYREESAPELVASNRAGLNKPLPERFKHLVTPGGWSLFKVDRWVTSSESELVHQDMIFRFHQPQLNPTGKPPAEAQEGSIK